METRTVKRGYMAFVKGDHTKALTNYWSGGWQTGTNKQSITTDLLNKATIAENKATIEMWCNWFNNSHKNKVEFDIVEVELEEINIKNLKKL